MIVSTKSHIVIVYNFVGKTFFQLYFFFQNKSNDWYVKKMQNILILCKSFKAGCCEMSDDNCV